MQSDSEYAILRNAGNTFKCPYCNSDAVQYAFKEDSDDNHWACASCGKQWEDVTQVVGYREVK
jgi:transposase-like protein